MIAVEVVMVTDQLRDQALLFRQLSADALGLRPAEHPWGTGDYIPSDAAGRTDVPGVWVAGNVADPAAQVGAAAAAGAAAGAQINAGLVAEETECAVAACRDPFSASSEASLCELVMGGRRHGL